MSVIDENFIHDILLDDDVYEALLCWARSKHGENVDIMSATVIENSVEVYLQTYDITHEKNGNLYQSWSTLKKENIKMKKEFINLDELERLVALEGVMA